MKHISSTKKIARYLSINYRASPHLPHPVKLEKNDNSKNDNNDNSKNDNNDNSKNDNNDNSKIMNILIVTKSLAMEITFVLTMTLRNALRMMGNPQE